MNTPGTCKPRIGLTAWRRHLPTSLGQRTDLYTLAAEYVDAIRDAGGIPFIIPHAADTAPYMELLDGLVVTGGGDLDSASYGAPNGGNCYDVSRDADDWEMKLVRAAHARELPTLGVCRGMQIMAVSCGGTLDQEISGSAGHPPMGPLKPEEILATRHTITLSSGSQLAEIYAAGARNVNTIHHQAVTDAGSFDVAARNEAGHIEAIEMHNGWPAIAVQWHPEKMQTAEEIAAERKLFRHFIAQAQAYAAARAAGMESTAR